MFLIILTGVASLQTPSHRTGMSFILRTDTSLGNHSAPGGNMTGVSRRAQTGFVKVVIRCLLNRSDGSCCTMGTASRSFGNGKRRRKIGPPLGTQTTIDRHFQQAPSHRNGYTWQQGHAKIGLVKPFSMQHVVYGERLQSQLECYFILSANFPRRIANCLDCSSCAERSSFSS